MPRNGLRRPSGGVAEGVMIVKRVFCCALVIWAMLSAGVLSADSGDSRQPDGFNDIKWGQERKTVDGLVKETVLPGSGVDDDTEYYTRENDLMQIGDARLSSICYVFKNNRFSEVMVQINGNYNSDAALRWLINSYGSYDYVDGSGYFWFFPDVAVLYGEDGDNALLIYLAKERG